MASQLGSAVTAGGSQAHEGQINTEMQNRAMAQQAFQNQQNQGLASRQMDQEAQMHSERMGISQDQFSQQLAESQRQREHEIGREDIAYGRGLEMQERQQNFQASQTAALQKWQMQQTQKVHAFELQLEKLQVLKDQARDKGQLDVLQSLATQDMELRKKRAQAAMSAAMAPRLINRTQREIEGAIDSVVDELGRKVSIEQQNQSLAGKFSPALMSRIDEMDRKASSEKFKTFQQGQEGFIDSINPLSANFGDVGAGIATGALEGAEWLNLERANFGRLAGLSGKSTTQASAVAGYVDPATMSETIKGRLIEGTLQQLGEMGFKNFNPDAARKLVGLAMSGGSKAEIAQLSTQAGIPTSTLKYLFDGAARGHEDTSNNPRYQKLMADEARYMQEAGYQPNDLKVLAVAKAKEAYGAKSKFFRTAATAFDDTNLDDYTSAIEYMGQLKKRGQYNDLAGSALQRVGLGDRGDRLRGLMAKLPAAQQKLEESAIGLGDIEQQSGDLRSMLPLMLGRANVESANPYLQSIEDLIKQNEVPE